MLYAARTRVCLPHRAACTATLLAGTAAPHVTQACTSIACAASSRRVSVPPSAQPVPGKRGALVGGSGAPAASSTGGAGEGVGAGAVGGSSAAVSPREGSPLDTTDATWTLVTRLPPPLPGASVTTSTSRSTLPYRLTREAGFSCGTWEGTRMVKGGRGERGWWMHRVRWLLALRYLTARPPTHL